MKPTARWSGMCFARKSSIALTEAWCDGSGEGGAGSERAWLIVSVKYGGLVGDIESVMLSFAHGLLLYRRHK